VLLAQPGREFHALALMTSELGVAGPAALPGVDASALAQYRAHLSELREERDEAEARNDLAALQAADGEIEWLERELRSAFGADRGAGEFAEKARKAVYNRIRAAIDAIADVHPELGRHLSHSVRTGAVCVYQPESPEEWEVASTAIR
jgi:hypothetical protein